MEIERKFLIKEMPGNLESFEHHELEQGYLSVAPVVRVRKEDDIYYLTYKGGGQMVREEYNLPLTRESYIHLAAKADGYMITKTRYVIPIEDGLKIELDIFTQPGPLVMAEVEFRTEEQALAFVPPAWFGEEVTFNSEYHNSNMSRNGIRSDASVTSNASVNK